MYGYIYKTTNLVNGKIYIGQKKSNTFYQNCMKNIMHKDGKKVLDQEILNKKHSVNCWELL